MYWFLVMSVMDFNYFFICIGLFILLLIFIVICVADDYVGGGWGFAG